jgi:hypothetical protein
VIELTIATLICLKASYEKKKKNSGGGFFAFPAGIAY